MKKHTHARTLTQHCTNAVEQIIFKSLPNLFVQKGECGDTQKSNTRQLLFFFF